MYDGDSPGSVRVWGMDLGVGSLKQSDGQLGQLDTHQHLDKWGRDVVALSKRAQNTQTCIDWQIARDKERD